MLIFVKYQNFIKMDRRKFLNLVGCGCSGLMINACSTTPITDRRQFKIIPESKLNAQAAQIYEKVKEKEKMSNDIKTLNEIKRRTRILIDLFFTIFSQELKVIYIYISNFILY